MKAKVFIIVAVISVIIPMVTFAQETKPSYSTACWSENDCTGVSGEWVRGGVELQWNENLKKFEPKACGASLGTCLSPKQDIKLQVELPYEGGVKSSVSDFAEYLSIFYKFFVAMIAVMSVVMIMWGGFKLIYRAGSAPAVTDAKETIFGAIAALVIALLSYSLLNLVNPKLVIIPDLRLPKIKPQTFSTSPWCPYTMTVDGRVPASLAATDLPIACSVKREDKSNPERSCMGEWCDIPTQGVCYYPNKYSLEPKCGKFVAQGNIEWSGNAYVDGIGLYAVCPDGSAKVVSYGAGSYQTRFYTDVDEQAAEYIIGDGYNGSTLGDMGKFDCGETPKGFAVVIEVNDDRSGSQCDDLFALGKVGQTACVPLSKESIGKIDWKAIPADKLLQVSDFPLVPYGLLRPDGSTYMSCDLSINRQNFPARDDKQIDLWVFNLCD